MEVRRAYVTSRPSPAKVLTSAAPRIRVAAAAPDTLALTSKAKSPETPVVGLSQLDAAKQAFWPKFLGGAAISAGGLGMMAVGCMGVATLPYVAFLGLFAGGIAVIGGGLALAWKGAAGVAEAHAALKHEGLG